MNTRATHPHSSPSTAWRSTLLAVFMSACVPMAPAQIFYSGLQDIPIPATFDGVYLDLDTGLSSTSAIAGWDLNPFFAGYAIANSTRLQPTRRTMSVDAPVLNLELGMLIGPTGTYAASEAGSEGHIGPAPGEFTAGTEGYLGFEFTPQDGSGPVYGWMRLVVKVNEPGALLRDWAYDTTGAPIPAGLAVVPEPLGTAVATGALLGAFLAAKCRRNTRHP